MASDVNSSLSIVPDRVTTASPWDYAATGLLAIAIFVAGTVTPFEFSVSLLYLVVILMVGRFCLGNMAQALDGRFWSGAEFELARFDDVYSVPRRPCAGKHFLRRCEL